jgi:hypothetical protein
MTSQASAEVPDIEGDDDPHEEENLGPEFESLIDGEEVLAELTEVLYRQVPLGHFDSVSQEPTMDIFRPRPDEHSQLSTSRSSKVSAQQAYEHRVNTLQLKSAGVWGVSVGELADVESRAVDDSALLPDDDEKTPPGHAYIDLRHLEETHKQDKRARDQFRQRLLIYARNRKRLYP